MSRLLLKCQIRERGPLMIPLLTFPVWKNLTLQQVRGSYYSSYCFQAHSGAISNWNITTVAVLIICGCVCPVCGVREPTHCLIIQSNGAGKLCFQPESCTWDSGEQRLLLQTPKSFYRQARKHLTTSTVTLVILSSYINECFYPWAVLLNCLSAAWRVEWQKSFTGPFGTVFRSSWTAILQTTATLSFCCRKSKLWVSGIVRVKRKAQTWSPTLQKEKLVLSDQ